MLDWLSRLAGQAGRWFDPVAAVVIGGLCTVQIATRPPDSTGLTVAVSAFTALGCCAVLVRHNHPFVIALTFAVAGCVPGVVLGSRWENAIPPSLVLAFVILAYTAGTDLDGAPSVLGMVALAFGNGLGDVSASIASMWVLTIPPWAAGKVMRSRTQLAAELAVRAEELEREQDAYAREAVRYERARIARDLHDIVAHNLSMIVVQAGAGRRALDTSPATAAASLRHIESGAQQAELQIDSLAELLGGDGSHSKSGGLQMLGELVQEASATGLSVTYRLSGAHDSVPDELAEVAYRVTQEGITNALKHAPGAPITVAVHASTPSLTIAVDNGPPSDTSPGLEDTGGAYGLRGLRDRLQPIGGSLRAGPTRDGGWRLEAELPRPH
jgi:signal transduction histidine kinase